MPIELKMPALSPTMEDGTLAKWLVKKGDKVSSGDLLAEIETDKATMEFEAVDEGTISELVVSAGTEGVKVGTVIALIVEEGEDANAKPQPKAEAREEVTPEPKSEKAETAPPPTKAAEEAKPVAQSKPELGSVPAEKGDRIVASPLARRIAAEKGISLRGLTGSGPNGRIVKADVEGGTSAPAPAAKAEAAPAPAPALAASPSGSAPKPAPAPQPSEIPHETVKLSSMRKVIARRLTESKQQVPHIYLTVDVRLDALLKLRSELNAALEPRNLKLSVNDLLIKALAASLIQVPSCNVSFAGDQLIKYSRADISVAVSIPGGLITPIVVGANAKSLSTISAEMTDLATRAKEGKLQPHEFQGGTASISNMGMFGITQFDAVINPPQGMIMAVGAGEKRPAVVDGALAIATVMSATGSFDHRAIDGADGAQLMKVFKEILEAPLGLVA